MQLSKFKKNFTVKEDGKAVDILAAQSGLSKARIKLAMKCGAVWFARKGKKQRRLRRATYMVRPGSRLAIYYDESILSLKPPSAHCAGDYNHYSIWFKPAGLMTQGTLFGDHCALTKQVEDHFDPRRTAYVVHRIDRETAGLGIVGHNREAASRFSGMFQRREIEKYYEVWVKGDLQNHESHGEIDLPLDGRPARTRFDVIGYDADTKSSHLRVQLISGRLHQIRRHFDMINHPVVGDPRYGRGNKNSTGLKLVATELKFTCPYGNGRVKVSCHPDQGVYSMR